MTAIGDQTPETLKPWTTLYPNFPITVAAKASNACTVIGTTTLDDGYTMGTAKWTLTATPEKPKFGLPIVRKDAVKEACTLDS